MSTEILKNPLCSKLTSEIIGNYKYITAIFEMDPARYPEGVEWMEVSGYTFEVLHLDPYPQGATRSPTVPIHGVVRRFLNGIIPTISGTILWVEGEMVVLKVSLAPDDIQRINEAGGYLEVESSTYRLRTKTRTDTGYIIVATEEH